MINFRKASIKDLGDIKEIVKITIPDFIDESINTINKAISEERFLCCEIDNKIIGFLEWTKNFNGIDSWFLKQITIHPDYRNKGIGKKFVDYFIKICKDNNVKKMFGRIDESNIKSQKMFSKVIGYKINTDLDKKIDKEITFEFDL